MPSTLMDIGRVVGGQCIRAFFAFLQITIGAPELVLRVIDPRFLWESACRLETSGPCSRQLLPFRHRVELLFGGPG
jgi:hypothetical protein